MKCIVKHGCFNYKQNLYKPGAVVEVDDADAKHPALEPFTPGQDKVEIPFVEAEQEVEGFDISKDLNNIESAVDSRKTKITKGQF